MTRIASIKIGNFYKGIMVSMNIVISLTNSSHQTTAILQSKEICAGQYQYAKLTNSDNKEIYFDSLNILFENLDSEPMIKVFKLEIFVPRIRIIRPSESYKSTPMPSPVRFPEITYSVPQKTEGSVMKKPVSSYENLLEGMIILIKLENTSESKYLRDICEIMGAVLFSEYFCDSFSIIISDGSSFELIQQARLNGSVIVSPSWVYNCIECRERLDFSIYTII